MNLQTAQHLVTLITPLLPPDVTITVTSEVIEVFHQGRLDAQQGYTFMPPGEVECLLSQLEDIIIMCAWGWWPLLNGQRAAFQIVQGQGQALLAVGTAGQPPQVLGPLLPPGHPGLAPRSPW
ncbi:hypothetical protein [Deinococcus arcticus]|uniref:Uncharacterized protein n=1 Tax=Deinococcus arcticus TaxID=2136176 RepID=A0A2T3WC93_9DEIO|nr:hypothetical protein [Deinococcus arcticus]PTA69521.1 hypothetical protein C8263_00340 [Deinococcus arcticus]